MIKVGLIGRGKAGEAIAGIINVSLAERSDRAVSSHA
jgi:hypothetical protein